MSSSQSSSSSSERERSILPLVALHDVVCQVDVVLGTSTISVRDCLRLRKQSIVRLIQAAGTDMQIIVNGVALAHGEVMIVDDSTAIRVTEITAPPSSDASS
jgi:flagellar motor switch protein FliN/FliY